MSNVLLFGLGLMMAGAIALFVVLALRRRFIARLSDADRRFQATFEQPVVGMVHLDAQWRLLRINDRFCEISGYGREELMGKAVDDITHPDDLARDNAERERLLTGQIDHSAAEKRYIRKDGRAIWVSITRSTVRDALGRPNYFVAVIEDITARKGAESQLISGEAGYRAVFDSAVEAMAVIDAEGTIQSANPAVERIFGYAPAELIGKHIKMLMPEAISLLPGAHPQSDRGVGHRTTAGIGPEAIGRHKDGTDFPVDLSIAKWRRSSDTFSTYVMRDVTERKQSQAALAASEAHFAAVYAQPGAGVAETNLQRRFVAANDRYCEIVGRSREDLLRLGMQDIVHPDDLQEAGPLFDRLVAAAEPFSIEKRYLKPDGSIACVMTSASPIWLGAAEPTIVVVAIDVTERKAAEAALRLSEEQIGVLQNEFAHMARVNDLGEMAAAIAHEINQPLTAIANYLNTGLFLGGSCDEETKQMMRDASAQALRAGDIVRRLREFVGKGSRDRTVERVEQLVDSAMALALIDARSSGIAVDRQAGAGDAEVAVDAIQIQQVLVNLLRNAVDALVAAPNNARRRLTVSTGAKANDMVEIIVADNGPGIAPQIASRLFEPFITTKPKGMGMGLSVCCRLIEAHGGTIKAAGEAGDGATFTVRLPQYRSFST